MGAEHKGKSTELLLRKEPAIPSLALASDLNLNRMEDCITHKLDLGGTSSQVQWRVGRVEIREPVSMQLESCGAMNSVAASKHRPFPQRPQLLENKRESKKCKASLSYRDSQ